MKRFRARSCTDNFVSFQQALDSWIFIQRNIKKMTRWSSFLARDAHKDSSKFYFYFFLIFIQISMNFWSSTKFLGFKLKKQKNKKSKPVDRLILACRRPLLGPCGLSGPAVGHFLPQAPRPKRAKVAPWRRPVQQPGHADAVDIKPPGRLPHEREGTTPVPFGH
jgi:hypothetical protein